MKCPKCGFEVSPIERQLMLEQYPIRFKDMCRYCAMNEPMTLYEATLIAENIFQNVGLTQEELEKRKLNEKGLRRDQ